MSSLRPVPHPNQESKLFWEGCRQHRLILQKCKKCETLIFYPRSFCPECMSDELDWIDVSGKGTIYSFTIVYRPPLPVFAEKGPYVLALIDLAEGPRMMSNVINISPSEVKVGMKVRCIFEDVNESISLPLFEPDHDKTVLQGGL